MSPAPQKPGQANGSGADERHRNEELTDQTERLEEELETLRARYEMWFLGVEKREPGRDREEMKRSIERLVGQFTRNTGLKFRMQSLRARFISYERMWTRSAREKEEGTYRRDLVKARRHLQERQREDAGREAKERAPAAEAPAAPGAGGAESVRTGPTPPSVTSGALPAGPPVPEPPAKIPAGPPARAPSRPVPQVAEDQLRALYDAYLAAKKRCNEDVSRLTYEALARSVQKQIPELMAKYRARSVEFKVVIQGGKAVLKAVPKA